MSTDGELPLIRRSGKSESAFRTISEVADELDVPQHVLRFWESKFPQVKPLKRGGGRRYYRPEDVALLRRIRDLLYSEGYTIKGVQKLLREGGHKEPGAAKADADLLSGELQLPPELDLSNDDQPDIAELDDGEEGDLSPELDNSDDEQAPDRVGESRFSAETRHELERLLDDLEQLRGLLQPR
ncbi:MAG: MerR family transcriptional regulator [Rhodospirillaceae bacterium]|nr:MerR family transcriptional regulator [Rhodospirillales bacterium]